MLISAQGEIAGSVSGGCLERDLIRQARFTEHGQSRFEVIRYDTTDDGEEFESLRSVSLGCQGIVDIGLECIGPGATHPVLDLIHESVEHGREGRAATIISITDTPATPPPIPPKQTSPRPSCPQDLRAESIGRTFILSRGQFNPIVDSSPVTNPSIALESISTVDLKSTGESNSIDCLIGPAECPSLGDPALTARIIQDLKDLRAPAYKTYETRLTKADVLLERIDPPKRWIIFGAGHDSIPLAETAQAIGWHVTVVDCRSSYSMPHRFFSNVDQLIRCAPSEISSKLNLTLDTLCILATHNYYHDREILGQLLGSPVAYIGILGPKKKGLSLLEDLKKTCFKWDPAALSKIYSPVGIDSGAESPQEIALSIITEALAVSKGRTAGFLKDREGPIHARGSDNTVQASLK